MRRLGKYPALGATMLVFLAVGCANSALQESAILIDYHRSGGIRGTDDHLVIKNDGTGTLTTNGSAAAITVETDVLSQLQDRMEAAGFSGLRANYEAPAGSADMYQYVIAYQGHTVRAQDASLPQALYPVIELLDRILQGG
jgi:hypothetical protein